MPYELRGNTVVKKDTGEIVGHSKTPEMAKRYFRKLEMIEHEKDGENSPPRRPKKQK